MRKLAVILLFINKEISNGKGYIFCKSHTKRKEHETIRCGLKFFEGFAENLFQAFQTYEQFYEWHSFIQNWAELTVYFKAEISYNKIFISKLHFVFNEKEKKEN